MKAGCDLEDTSFSDNAYSKLKTSLDRGMCFLLPSIHRID